jgi:hypothetical protein
MPRFFFSRVCPEHSVTDIVGEDVADRAEATRRAREIAMEIASEQLEAGRGPSGWVEVEDEAHRPVFMLPLRAVAS